MVAGGHAWLLGVGCVVAGGGVCSYWWGGMCGYWWGACVVVGIGGHAWLPGGMYACGGHVWLLAGGMHGCRGGCGKGGACVVKGECAWQWQRGDMHGKGGHAWRKGSVRGIRQHTEIRSMSGRYASYWNAFLSSKRILIPVHPG